MIRNNWQMFVSEVSQDLCSNIVKNLIKLPEQDATTFGGQADHRRSKVRWISGEHGLKKLMMDYVIQANTAFGVDIHHLISELQFTEYDAEYQGKYDVHHDIDWNANKPHDRKLSIVVQLTDPDAYEGGDLSFSEVENPKSSDLRKQGTIIVFPSYLQHSVSPVTCGVRHSLVSWVWGPRWR
jgi:PKHD-type hydroxylase